MMLFVNDHMLSIVLLYVILSTYRRLIRTEFFFNIHSIFCVLRNIDRTHTCLQMYNTCEDVKFVFRDQVTSKSSYRGRSDYKD